MPLRSSPTTTCTSPQRADSAPPAMLAGSAPVAQRIEQQPSNLSVAGSIPAGGTSGPVFDVSLGAWIEPLGEVPIVRHPDLVPQPIVSVSGAAIACPAAFRGDREVDVDPHAEVERTVDLGVEQADGVDDEHLRVGKRLGRTGARPSPSPAAGTSPARRPGTGRAPPPATAGAPPPTSRRTVRPRGPARGSHRPACARCRAAPRRDDARASTCRRPRTPRCRRRCAASRRGAPRSVPRPRRTWPSHHHRDRRP